MLREYYKEHILPEIEPFLKESQELKEKGRRILFTVSALVGVFLFFFLVGGAPSWSYIIVLSAGIFVILKNSGRTKRAELKRKGYSIVADRVAKYHHPSLECRPWHFIPEDSFKRSMLFSSPDSYTGFVLVDGELEGTPFAFSYVHAREEVHSNSDDNNSYYQTIFSGLFIRFVLPWKVSAKILIKAGGISWGMGGFFGNYGTFQPAIFENPIFNRNFRVYCTDIVDANMIITPLFMERLLKLKWSVGKEIYMSIIPDRVYVAVSGVKPPKTGLFIDPFSYTSAEELNDFINTGLSIIRALLSSHRAKDDLLFKQADVINNFKEHS